MSKVDASLFTNTLILSQHNFNRSRNETVNLKKLSKRWGWKAGDSLEGTRTPDAYLADPSQTQGTKARPPLYTHPSWCHVTVDSWHTRLARRLTILLSKGSIGIGYHYSSLVIWSFLLSVSINSIMHNYNSNCDYKYNQS